MDELPTNTTLSHYRIVSKLGAGGMGEVYLAQDTKLDRKVALKVLPAEVAMNRDRMERFVREAKAAAALNHPHIAQIHEIGEHQGTHFIVMEYIEGVTLREKIQHEHTELKRLLKYLQQVAEGLSKAHSAGIVHRDLKPDNIMITRDGFAKILDFGLAKLIEQQQLPGGDSSDVATAVMAQHSTPGTVMGTVGYMSPEQAQGKTKEIDQRSDIFSFGCILFEAATAKKAFEGESVIKSLHMVVYEPAPAIADFNPSAPPELQRIVRRCLAKDPDERYQTIKDVAIELKELRRELEGAGINTIVSPTGTSETKAPFGTDTTSTQSMGEATSAPSSSPSNRASSAEYVVSGIKQHKLAAVIALLMLVVGLTALGLYLGAPNASGAIESIAVLPFENTSKDADTEYLSDGLAESLIYRLSQLPKLKVTPTSSVMRYRGKHIDVNAVAGELGVSAVMTGRIAQRGDGLTISVELIDGRNNTLIWGEQYDRKMSDLLATQREIASTVTEKLQLKLSGEDAKGITKRYTNNSEAYQLYLKGRYYWNKRTPDNIRKAIEQFRAAADKDPGFALAYVGIADAQMVLLYYTRMSGQDVISQAKANATRALEIDDSLAEAHASLGIINNLSWNWAESEKEFKRAIELNPNYATARHWYSRYLRNLGRSDEALTQIRQAHETDPLSLAINDNLAENLMEQGDLNSAIEQCMRSIELDPNYWAAHRTLASAYLKQGRKAEALVEAQKADKLLNNESVSLKTLGYVQAVLGNRKEALAIVKQLEERYPKQQADGRDIAEVYAGLGEKDQAFAWLERDFQRHDHSLAQLRLEAGLVPISDDPRFKDLLRRMGMPQ
jgi:serine/threonine protein kinase/tetratricopeptide (TPR) repeat protein